jgi:hypothetical protein
MNSRAVTIERLVPILDELVDPASPRNHATENLIEVGRSLVRSPFVGGITDEERILLPCCVRLGVAVRIIEIGQGLPERGLRSVGFNQELKAAIEAGYIPIGALRPEVIFWKNIIPDYILFGYKGTTV